MLLGKRIFYIEDDLKNRMIVQTILEAQGAVVDFEQWGFPEIALRKMLRFRPNLILLDLMFRNQMTGYDIFDAIRRQPFFNQIPVVAVSAADPAMEIPKAQARGLAGFIGKPLEIALFPQQLERVMSGEHIWYSG